MKLENMTPMEQREWRLKKLSKRDGFFCFHPSCPDPEFKSNEDVTFDHWIPQSKGGTWDISNLRLMHKRCNAFKSDDMPNPDGTLPEKKRELNAADRRNAIRSTRPEVCEKCQSGRILGPDEECDVCGSGPMPPRFPQWSKMKPNDCTHEGIFWCWCCMSGIVERVPAIYSVLDAEGSLDNQ